MIPKRGQVSVFIIIGIIILIVAGVFIALRPATETQVSGPDFAGIRNYLRRCAEDTARDAVLVVSLQGGYYNLPQNSFEFLGLRTPYYMYEGQVDVPSIEDVEQELSDYVSSQMPACADNELFWQQGYEISIGQAETNVSVNLENVVFEINMPFTMKYGDAEEKVSDFFVTVDADLYAMQFVAEEFMARQTEDTDSLFVSNLLDLSFEYGLVFDVLNFDGGSLVSLTDNSTKIDGNLLIYSFALGYDISEYPDLEKDEEDFLMKYGGIA